MAKTATLKKTSEQRCMEAFEKVFPRSAQNTASLDRWIVQIGWNLCWRYLESRLLEEIQS